MSVPRRARKTTADVLVALVPKPRDLVLARERGWYRARSAEMVERVGSGAGGFTDIAFYQPESFKSERQCIRYYATIRGVATVRRRELLPEEPDHPRAGEFYLRFDIGEVTELEEPIFAARGRRILFVPTNWERIAAAEDINDLFVGTPIEDRLYRRLRAAKLLPEREYYVELRDPVRSRSGGRHYYLDMALFCGDRDLAIECDGDTWHANRERAKADNERANLLEANRWQILRFNTEQIERRLEETFGIIHEAVEKYGGVVEPEGVIRRFGPDGTLGPGQAALPFGK